MPRSALTLAPRLREARRRHRNASRRVTTPARAPKSPLRTATPTDSRRDSRRTCAHPNDPDHRRCRRRRPTDRWVETTFEEACRPCSARRHKTSCRDVRPDTVQELASRDPTRRQGADEEARPTTGWITAPEPALSSLRRAARRCCHLRAVHAPNRLPTHSSPETTSDSGDPKVPLVYAIPCEELTPDDHLAVIPRHPSCRALRKCKHPAECAARGRTRPTLPPAALESKQDQ